MPAFPDPILVFGGTFDPPHRAHVALALRAAATLACTRILFVPASRNPLKETSPMASNEQRLEMLRLALDDVTGAEVCTFELERGGPSYFVETIEQIRAAAPDSPLFFLIGADQALVFHRWRRWRRILDLATPAVLLREPWDRSRFEAAVREHYGPDEAARWMAAVVDAPLLDVSATRIRECLASGSDTGGDLDPRVAAFIREHGLYGARP